jgi:hypothetical protein
VASSTLSNTFVGRLLFPDRSFHSHLVEAVQNGENTSRLFETRVGRAFVLLRPLGGLENIRNLVINRESRMVIFTAAREHSAALEKPYGHREYTDVDNTILGGPNGFDLMRMLIDHKTQPRDRVSHSRLELYRGQALLSSSRFLSPIPFPSSTSGPVAS